jgi:hypothetical protein
LNEKNCKVSFLRFVAQLVGTYLAVAVGISGVYYGLQSKGLSFSVVARSPLVDVSQQPLADLKVTYKNKNIERVESLSLQFENSGNVSINAQDFEKPMEVVLDKGCRVLRAEVADASPPTLKPKISSAATIVAIAPLLLNANDRFTLTVVVSGDSGVPKLDARISGIREVTTVDRRQNANPWRKALPVIVAFFIVMCFSQYLGGLAMAGRTKLSIVPWTDVFGAALLVAISASSYSTVYMLYAGLSFVLVMILPVVIVLASLPVASLAIKRLRALVSEDVSKDT